MTCGLSREVDGTLSVTWTAAASVTNPEGFHVENDALQPPAQARLFSAVTSVKRRRHPLYFRSLQSVLHNKTPIYFL
ncbi:hypothetical protein F2P81_025946 [Scophthalmus maximus]|uniref:Uncharacterized protein n=1 Tax=Scophthalmus maximus TaxID=52904 RepID=A0A6A4RS03_SCOMX|nr:hypothetical protein F2P81_025946 [Scophthalmus maximus]